MQPVCLEEMLPGDRPARTIWAVVGDTARTIWGIARGRHWLSMRRPWSG